MPPANKEYDYYAILDIPRDATLEHITLAYRKQALRCHPQRDPNLKHAFTPPELWGEKPFPPLIPCAEWSLINRAFDVLSHPLRREVYDRHGERGLIYGVALPNGYFQPYTYHNNYMKTYYDVFGTYSPYLNLIDAVTNPPVLYSTDKGIGLKERDKPIEKIIYLDLKEIFFGAVKRMTILRHEFIDGFKTQTEIREKVLVVPIAPGIPFGTKIKFKEEGDQYPTKIPADIIFVIDEKPHEVFERLNDDLHMNYKIDLKKALCGFKLNIKTIDDRKISMIISDVIKPGYVKEIVGEGLPKYNNSSEKGNLYIHFNVEFPTTINRELRSKFAELFNEQKTFERYDSQTNKQRY